MAYTTHQQPHRHQSRHPNFPPGAGFPTNSSSNTASLSGGSIGSYHIGGTNSSNVGLSVKRHINREASRGPGQTAHFIPDNGTSVNLPVDAGSTRGENITRGGLSTHGSQRRGSFSARDDVLAITLTGQEFQPFEKTSNTFLSDARSTSESHPRKSPILNVNASQCPSPPVPSKPQT